MHDFLFLWYQSSVLHSKKIDSDERNQGDQYKNFPLDISTFYGSENYENYNYIIYVVLLWNFIL